MRRAFVFGGGVVVAVATSGGIAHAQATVTYTPDFDPDRFVLTADPDAIGLTDGARPQARGTYAVALALRVGGAPLSICVRDDATGVCTTQGDLVGTRMGADLVATVGFGRVAAHLQLPVVLYQGSDFAAAMGEPTLSVASVGDLRLGGKLGLVRAGRGALAWDLTASLPTGGGDNFVGDAGTVVENRLLADWRGGRLALGAGVGYAWRSHDSNVGDLDVGDEVVWSVATAYDVVPARAQIGLALYGRVGVDTATEPMNGGTSRWEERPAEALLSTTYHATPTVALEAGVGAGLDTGYGAPPFRALVGVRWTAHPDAMRPAAPVPVEPPPPLPVPVEPPPPPAPVDSDGDGLTDDVDACPAAAEDVDQFQDEDGCPDLDDDGDGIADSADACPRAAEVVNGVDDTDGCPDERRVLQLSGIIEFDSNRARIRSRSNAALDEVAAAMTAEPTIRVRIEGHTDDVGDAEQNLALSQQRAEAVRAYLVRQGIAADRLDATGFGESRPRVDGTTDEARRTNRRVEFVVLP